MNDHVNGEEHTRDITLSPADAAALDAILAAHIQPRINLAGAVAFSAEPSIDPARAARIHAWLNVAAADPLPKPSTDLLQRTLSAVEHERMKLRPASQISPPQSRTSGTPRRWVHLREIAAMFVAAAILGAVLIPAIGQARQSYRRTLCATNMASLASAFSMYAAANDHALPCLAPSANANWLNPAPTGHTNTANLLPLLNAGYITPVNLICAGQGFAEGTAATPTHNDIRNCSYSYVNLFGPDKPTWNADPATIILADRNPLFSGADASNPNLNSFNHQQKGTYVLHADGHVTWETSPNVGLDHDNIWTVALAANTPVAYTGTEISTSPRDTFLAP